MHLSAVILAGGNSSRMGQDKAWIEICGQPLMRRAVAPVRDSGIRDVFISGRTDTDYSTLGCSVLFDLEPGGGPLGGIERALATATAPLVLVLAVDLPAITAAFLRRLAAYCNPLTGAVPRLRGELEPLAAIYPQRCHSIARDCLRESRRAARDFANACLRAHAVRTLPVSGADSGCFKNWNVPSDVTSATSPTSCHRADQNQPPDNSPKVESAFTNKPLYEQFAWVCS